MIEKVNVDNFNRAETDRYFVNIIKLGGDGKFYYLREPVPIDRQNIVRMNRDTLYSAVVIDLYAGPATITLPDGNGRYVALLAIDQDHYVVQIDYDAGEYTFTKDQCNTRYMVVLIRILADADDPNDIAEVNKLQDQLKFSQDGTPEFKFGDWDADSLNMTRKLLLGLGSQMTNFRNTFGKESEVSPIHHLIGTAGGWGGNPDKDAIYEQGFVENNDGQATYVLTVPADVPVDGFWSISVYNADGYFEENAEGLYSVNNLTAKKEADGSVKVHFGGDSNSANYLPITPGWNYTVRLYRPHQEILDGSWVFPTLNVA